MEFDSLVIADWPRGLRLAKQLSWKGDKTAYLEITPYLKKPFPLFLDDSKEKTFLENLGFLSPLEEGFCFLNSESVLFFKELAQNKKESSEGEWQKGLKFKDKLLNKSVLKENLLAYLGRNLAGRVFQFNDSCISEDSLPLFSDCFLFEPSLRKKEEFQKIHSHISYFKINLEEFHKTNISQKSLRKKSLTPLERNSSIKNQLEFLGLSAKNIFCLSDRVITDKADFQWKASFFSADLGAYESIIPEHFLVIKQLFFPWCYDNLMSVFQKQGVLELWMRLPVDRDDRSVVQKAQENLESFFPGAKFQLKNQAPLKSFHVYGEILSSCPPPLAYMQNSKDFFQASLAQDIKKETQISQTLIEKRIKQG